MEAGVSLSVPRNGFSVGHSLEISDPFARELGLSQVSSLNSISLSREFAFLYERNSSVFSQVFLAVESDLAIDLPDALKGDPLYSGSGDDSMPLFSVLIDPDPVLYEGKGIKSGSPSVSSPGEGHDVHISGHQGPWSIGSGEPAHAELMEKPRSWPYIRESDLLESHGLFTEGFEA